MNTPKDLRSPRYVIRIRKPRFDFFSQKENVASINRRLHKLHIRFSIRRFEQINLAVSKVWLRLCFEFKFSELGTTVDSRAETSVWLDCVLYGRLSQDLYLVISICGYNANLDFRRFIILKTRRLVWM